MEGLISTFHIDWKLMIAQLINFGLVFCAFYLLAAKPLKNLIQSRTEEINTGLLNAKQNVEILKATEKEYKEIISKAKSEADLLFKEAKKEALAKKTEMLEQAKIEVASIVDSGKKNLENEKIKMVADAKKEIVSLVMDVTKKVIGKEVGPSFNQSAIKELESMSK